MPRAPILVGVGAPGSFAIGLTTDRDMTLAGSTRRGHTHVYASPARLRSS